MLPANGNGTEEAIKHREPSLGKARSLPESLHRSILY